MGRYRGGHRYRSHRRKKNNNNNCDGDNSLHHQGMEESDLNLVEKYLIEYRTKAFAIFYSNPKDEQHTTSEHPFTIGRHVFPGLTTELCKQPYLDLPDTLSAKERRSIHSLCCSLNLYHRGAGTKTHRNNATETESNAAKRRIVVSIFANGLDNVPDIEYQYKNKGSFPARLCRPWYTRASHAMRRDASKSDVEANPYKNRILDIEGEKTQISMFARYPEQSLRTSLRNEITVCDESNKKACEIDTLDFGEIESLDLSIVPTPKQCPWMLVDTVEKLKECIEELMFGVNHKVTNKSKLPLLYELAFDMEMHSFGSSEQKAALRTCLIQLTSNVDTKDYVIDPLAPDLWDAIPIHLGPLFADPNIVKIGHGISGMDTTSLHRDFGILVVNAFDTYEASAILANSVKGGLGLAKLCKHYALPSWKEYEELKQKFQCSDWSKRPLDERALEYGRFDVRCLILLRKLLIRDLIKLDMIGGKSPLDYLNKNALGQVSSISTSDVSSVHVKTDTARESFTESSFSYEGSSNIDVSSETVDSFDEFKDAKESFDDEVLHDGSTDPLVHSRDFSTISYTPSEQLILNVSDLPAFHHLMQAMKISNKRCLRLWTDDNDESIAKHPALLSMIEQAGTGKGQGRFWSDAHHKLYFKLAEWRQQVAEREEVDEFDLCSLDFLVYVAYSLPRDKNEMRRFSYFLPDFLENENLPYCQELCQLVATSEAFALQKEPPLLGMERFGVVFYKYIDPREKQKKTTLKILAGTALSLTTIILCMRARRR
ncbi:hypothetical protein ACHAW6_007972 [Cyclotella cf. meneghiniana]